jgi:hypothetical protein
MRLEAKADGSRGDSMTSFRMEVMAVALPDGQGHCWTMPLFAPLPGSQAISRPGPRARLGRDGREGQPARTGSARHGPAHAQSGPSPPLDTAPGARRAQAMPEYPASRATSGGGALRPPPGPPPPSRERPARPVGAHAGPAAAGLRAGEDSLCLLQPPGASFQAGPVSRSPPPPFPLRRPLFARPLSGWRPPQGRRGLSGNGRPRGCGRRRLRGHGPGPTRPPEALP